MSMIFIGSRTCWTTTDHSDGGACAVRVLGPNRACRSATSAAVSPVSRLLPSSVVVSSRVRAHHRGGWISGVAIDVGAEVGVTGTPIDVADQFDSVATL